MSFQVRDICYADGLSAMQAVAAGINGQVVIDPTTGSSYWVVVSAQASSATTVLIETRLYMTGTLIASKTMSPSLVQCSAATGSDAVPLAWSFVAAFAAAASIVVLRRAL